MCERITAQTQENGYLVADCLASRERDRLRAGIEELMGQCGADEGGVVSGRVAAYLGRLLREAAA